MSTLYILIINLCINILPIQSAVYSTGDIISPFTLNRDDEITSFNLLVRFIMQTDGNVVVYSRSSNSESWDSVWSSDTVGDGYHLTLQNDGHLVLFNMYNSVLWKSNSITGTAPFRLIVSDDIAVYIIDSSNTAVWSTNPSFVKLKTIWSDSFESNEHWIFNGAHQIPSNSDKCPNYPDYCLKLFTESGTVSYADRSRNTDISSYSALQFQVDIRGYGLDPDPSKYERCGIWWHWGDEEWIEDDTLYYNELYRNVIIDIPSTSSYTSIIISIGAVGDDVTDECYFDNAILRGIITQTRTQNPTKTPILFATKNPSQASTYDPSTHPTIIPTNDPTLFPTNNPTSFPTNNPTSVPTNNPTSFPTSDPTASPIFISFSSSHSQHTKYKNISSDNINTASDSKKWVIIANASISVGIGLCGIALLISVIYFRNKRNNASAKRSGPMSVESPQKNNIQCVPQQSLDKKQAIFEENVNVDHIEQCNVMSSSVSSVKLDECRVENGLERLEFQGNEDVIDTEGKEPNLGSDEFVVVGDDDDELSDHQLQDTITDT